MSKAKGFTLIELIMVIVILGILAAVALPRYVSLKTEANIAAVKGMLGAIRSTIMIYYASTALYATDPAYPPLATLQNGSWFSDGKVPADPINNSTLISPTIGPSGSGGWAYWVAGGSVVCNVGLYSLY